MKPLDFQWVMRKIFIRETSMNELHRKVTNPRGQQQQHTASLKRRMLKEIKLYIGSHITKRKTKKRTRTAIKESFFISVFHMNASPCAAWYRIFDSYILQYNHWIAAAVQIFMTFARNVSRIWMESVPQLREVVITIIQEIS